MFGDDIASYLPEHIKPFSAQLRNFPLHYEKWVHATTLPADLYQGDVLNSAVVVNIDGDGNIQRAELPEMILSCTCDVQPRQGEFALIAPVYDFEHYKANHSLIGGELDNHLASLMRNEIANLFFIPAGQRLRASVVDFQVISTVSVDYLHSKGLEGRLTSLSQVGHYFFLMKLAHHMTRPEAADAKRA